MDAPSASSKSGWATEQDWDVHMATICALYQVHTLTEVVRIMAEREGFFATPKMFKDRLTKLGKAKKLTAADVAAAEHYLQMHPGGVAHVRQREITAHDLARYHRRRAARLRRRQAAEQDKESNQSQTVSPSPRHSTPLSSCLSALATLTFPLSNELHTLEEILSLANAFIVGSFTAGAWQVSSDHEPIMSDGRGLDANMQGCLAAFDATFKILNMDTSQIYAEEMLELAIGKLRYAVVPEMHAGVLLWTLDIVRKMSLWGIEFALAQRAFTQIVALASANLASDHPFRRLWELLAQLDPITRNNVLRQTHSRVVSSLELYLPTGKWIVNARLACIQRGEDMTVVEWELRHLLQEMEEAFGPEDPRLLMGGYALLCCLLNQRRHDDVVALAERLSCDAGLWPYLRWQCLEILAVSERAVGRLAHAMQFQTTANSFALQTWGTKGRNYVNSLGSGIALEIVAKLAERPEVAYLCECWNDLSSGANHGLDGGPCMPSIRLGLDEKRRLNSGSLFMIPT